MSVEIYVLLLSDLRFVVIPLINWRQNLSDGKQNHQPDHDTFCKQVSNPVNTNQEDTKLPNIV